MYWIRTNWKKFISLYLTAALLFSLCVFPARGASLQSAKPEAANCAVYRYASEDMTPTLYIWNVVEPATYRVYQSPVPGEEPAASANRSPVGSCCVVPLDAEQLSGTSGTLYVSRQAAGETESERVAVAYGAPADPAVTLSLKEINRDDINAGNKAVTSNMTLNPVSSPAALKLGRYYVAEIGLRNFRDIQSLTLPVKYDPSVLELAKLSYDAGLGGYTLGGGAVNAPNGAMIPTFDTGAGLANGANGISASNYVGGRPDYGIGAMRDLYYWGAKQDTGNASAQTPYVNTTTGLVKLEFASDESVNISMQGAGNGFATAASSRTMIRLYFKCIAAPAGTDLNSVIHFATQADAPASAITNAERQKYYCITTPNGYKAAIQAIDLMAPPLSVGTQNAYSETARITFSAKEVYELPQSFSTADQIRELVNNRVKIYNYTNSSLYAIDNTHSGATDLLLLTPSGGENGAARQGDRIKVYDADGGLVAGPTEVNAEGGVAMNLGSDNLSASGGSLYVTVTRSGTESAMVEVPYGPEMTRDVSFRVNSSGYQGADGSAVQNQFTVSTGDQIRLDLYFNHFDDLLAYTFNLRFDPSVVQAADSSFHKLLEDGYISEDSMRAKDACLEVGTDLTGVTANEEIAYQTWNAYEAGQMERSEVEAVMDALGIGSLEQLKSIADDVAVKYSFGDASWNGGLLFTGPVRLPGTNGPSDPGRDENSVYPYVNNSTGVLRIASASLVQPPLVLNRDENGYHFLSAYFVATTSGRPDFQIAGGDARADGVEIVSSKDGTEIVLSGPGVVTDFSGTGAAAATVCSMPFTAHWQAYGLEKVESTPVIKLYGGNAKASDNDLTALFLYDGYAFRDPGFSLRGANGAVLVDTAAGRNDAAVTRYYMENGNRVELPAWDAAETLDCFSIPAGKRSATYELFYAYTDEAGRSVTAKRMVHVIYARGDLNGDGRVDVFDEQSLIDNEEDISDALYKDKTLTDQETLHDWLMGVAEYTYEYVMPVARAPDEFGDGSADGDGFTMWLAFYPAGVDPPAAEPLDPAKLSTGSQVVAVVRYQNLSALSDGLINAALSVSYDPAHFALNHFSPGDRNADVLLWQAAAQTLNAAWIGGSSEYTAADASDAALPDGTRRIHLQYLATEPGEPVFIEEDGILAAFSFTVSDEEFTDAPFAWLDYQLAMTDGSEYDKAQLLNGETPFVKPADVLVSAQAPAGYSITGQVKSYNAKNPITYALYRQDGGGNYESTAAYSGTLVEAAATTTDKTQVFDFEIPGVADGTYQLVISKTAHLDFTVLNIVVNGTALDLTAHANARVSLMVMGVGDLNGDGVVNATDKNFLMRSSNFNKIVETEEHKVVDINGDGVINTSDKNILTRSANFNKNAKTHFTVDAGKIE